MIYSLLNKDGIKYISLHAEQVFQNFQNFDSQLGYFTSELTVGTVNQLADDLQNLDINTIVIDFSLLEDVHNCHAEFRMIIDYFLDKNIEFSLIRISSTLYSKLNMHLLKLIENINETAECGLFVVSYKFDSNRIGVLEGFDSKIYSIYSNELQERIKTKYLVPNDKKYSDSSKVELPKYINIKLYIEDKDISYYGLYLLCKKSINNGYIPNLNQSKRPIVFFQSIQGAYLASIFSKIGVLDMAYLDHIGPVNHIYRTILNSSIKSQRDYILISDVICMGTEIQIAKNIIEYEDSKVIANISIVNVMVIDKLPKIPVLSLFELNKENNKDIGYEINTNFAVK